MEEHHAGHISGDKHAVHLALVQRLRAQAAEVQRLAAGLNEETLATRGVPGKWSMKELICHCRRMESIFGERLNRMLTEETTIVPYDNPDADEVFVALTNQPTADVLAEYLGEREALCQKARRAHALRMAPQSQAPSVSAFRSALSDRVHGAPRGTPHLSALSASRALRQAAALSFSVSTRSRRSTVTKSSI